MKVKCSMCEGTGKYWVSPEDACKNCNGTGDITLPDPTQEGGEFWIQANGRTGGHTSWNEGCPGKWLLFINKKNVDDVWKMIRQETINENLGSSSKVSTKKGWLSKGMPEDYVICVHTPNSKDKEDVDRVRNHLRQLGFTGQLGYKTDQATLDGKEELIYKE